MIISVDCAFKDAASNDWVAIHKYAMMSTRRYLLDRRTENLGFGATKVAIKEMARGGHAVEWLLEPMPTATQVLVEDKANGPAVIEQLRCDPNFGLAVISYNPKGSKTQRFVAACADAEGGLIYFPEDAPWLGTLRKILCDYAGEGSIPKDDDCDAWSQAVNWSRQYQYGLLAFEERERAIANGTHVTHRCEIENELGETVVLVWDDIHNVWVDRKSGKTYPPGGDEDESDGSVSGIAAVDSEGSQGGEEADSDASASADGRRKA